MHSRHFSYSQVEVFCEGSTLAKLECDDEVSNGESCYLSASIRLIIISLSGDYMRLLLTIAAGPQTPSDSSVVHVILSGAYHYSRIANTLTERESASGNHFPV